MSLGPDLFTAADAARFCGVDLKTIHNWASRGKLPHWKTEGRHVRIHRVDLVAFLRHYEMPLPDALLEGTPHVAIIDPDASSLGRLRRALDKRFLLDAYDDAVDALMAFGAAPPQAMVVSAPVPGIDLAHVIARLHAAPLTTHLRVVVVGEPSLDAAATLIPRDRLAPAHVREALESITGLA